MNDDIILKVITGSRAYGLETPESDYDFHGVYVTPTSELLAIGPHSPKSRTWNESEEQDNVQWELGHFLFLATKCNPTILETFVAPIEEEDTAGRGRELRSLFPLVLTRKRLYDAFLGYSHNQQKKMLTRVYSPLEDQPAPRNWKFAVQYLRVLLQGERLLRTGELVLSMHDYPENARSLLMDIKRGGFSMGFVIDLADEFKKRLELAFAESSIREAPDFDAVNKFLLKVRKDFW